MARQREPAGPRNGRQLGGLMLAPVIGAPLAWRIGMTAPVSLPAAGAVSFEAGEPLPVALPDRSAPAHGRPRCLPLGAVLPHGVIRFQHRRKISSILIRDTVAPIAIRTTSGSCSLRDIKSPNTGAVMSIIPLDLQRRCERRWAARFSRPIPSAAPRNQRPVRESPEITAPAKSKEKPAGLKRQA